MAYHQHDYEMKYIKTNGVHLHTIFAGDPEGEPIILLHGFPEFWYGWRKQIPYLAEQGLRVIVPDQRGYNLSDKPKNIRDYYIDTLADDIAGLIDELGYEQVTLVGHDWGAAVAWWTATRHAGKLKRLGILNVPYPTIMQETLQQGNIGQMLKSWYMGFFQIPFAPEALIALGNYRAGLQALERSSKPNTFSEEDFAHYQQAWSQPNAMKSMINWYRAIRYSTNLQARGYDAISKNPVETLILWGEDDAFLGKELAAMSLERCEQGHLIYFEDTTHWIQHEQAEAINPLLVALAKGEALADLDKVAN
jgi:pimeloyl-ACP methyl ester carboxylesterase